MIVIWKGLGILAPIQVVLTFALVQLLVDTDMGDGYYTAHEWPKILAVILGSGSVLPVGYWLNGRAPERLDPTTGELPARPPARHTLFFIPYQHWSWIIAAFYVVADLFRR